MNFPRALVSSDQLTPPIVAHVLSVAGAMHGICAEGRRSDLLADKIVALIFLEPSSRTMLSFQAACHRLMAGPLMVHGKEASSIVKGESIADTMKLVSGYADLVVARLPETGAAVGAAEVCAVPFINAGDGANEHPTQALIDAYTIHRELGTLEGLHIACGFDPLHSRSIHSLVKVMMRYPGVSFTFVSPEPLKAPAPLLGRMRALNIPVYESTSIDAMKDADILYLNRLQEERFDSRETFDQYRHEFSLVSSMLSSKNRLILDPLPRVDEIAPEVDGHKAAAYFRQAHNGVPVRMALLSLMLDRPPA